MKLILERLENVKERYGKIIARCPACAEIERDTAGDNLAIFDNGNFACSAFQGDREHSKRILQISGDRSQFKRDAEPMRRTPAPRSPDKPLPPDFHVITRKGRRLVYESPDVQRHIAAEFGVSVDTIRGMAMPEGGALGFFPRCSIKGSRCTPDRIAYIFPKGIKIRSPFGDSGPRFAWACGKATEPWRFTVASWRRWVTHYVITEGESDLIAMLDSGLSTLAPQDNTAVVASPGASFRPEWAAMFAGRSVTLALDGDDAGTEAASRTAALIRQHAADVKIFNLASL